MIRTVLYELIAIEKTWGGIVMYKFYKLWYKWSENSMSFEHSNYKGTLTARRLFSILACVKKLWRDNETGKEMGISFLDDHALNDSANDRFW